MPDFTARLRAFQPLWKHGQISNKSIDTLTVFHFESPKASELGTTCEEQGLLQVACALAQHRFVSFRPLDLTDLTRQLKYVFETWEVSVDNKLTLQFCLHFSCHGNESGIQVGSHSVSWTELGNLLGECSGKYDIPYFLAISACGGDTLSLANAFTGQSKPLFIFSFDSEVEWHDASLTWSLLYRWIRGVRIGDVEKWKGLVKTIRDAGLGKLRYHRWAGKKYLFYPTKPTP